MVSMVIRSQGVSVREFIGEHSMISVNFVIALGSTDTKAVKAEINLCLLHIKNTPPHHAVAVNQ